MFGIGNSRDFFNKLQEDHKSFKAQPDSASLAVNCILVSYHLHEWVWGDWLKEDYDTRRAMKIRDRDSFVNWISAYCPWFPIVRDLANGAKHFCQDSSVQTARVGGFGEGPFGVGPFGQPYLLIDLGESTGILHRWQRAEELIDQVVGFWEEFFDKYRPDNRGQASN